MQKRFFHWINAWYLYITTYYQNNFNLALSQNEYLLLSLPLRNSRMQTRHAKAQKEDIQALHIKQAEI
jgi:hypothetical protein